MSIKYANSGIETDGLVLYYDLLSRQSFPGEGGINLLNYNAAQCNGSATPYWAGVDISYNNYEKRLKSFKVTTLNGGYLYSGTYYATGIIIGTMTPYRRVPTGTYSFSCKVWAPKGRVIKYGFRYNPQGEESGLTLIGNNSWQTIRRNNLTTNQITTLNIQIRGAANNGNTSASTPDVIEGFTFYVAEPMINSGSYSLPFYENSRWNPVTASVTGSNPSIDTIPTTYTKNGSNSWTDARVYSDEGFVDGAYVGFSAGFTNKAFMVALNSDPSSGINWTNLDYAIYCKNDATYEIRESGGSTITPSGDLTYTTDTLFEIKYDGTNISYFKDNTIVRQVARSLGSKLYLDSSFWSDGTVVNNLMFTDCRTNYTGSGGYRDLSGVSNENSNVHRMSFDATGSISSALGNTVTFGSTNTVLKNLTHDGNNQTYECWVMLLGPTVSTNDGYFFGRIGFHTLFRQRGSAAYPAGDRLGTPLIWYNDNTNIGVGSELSVNLNTWYHLAVTIDEANNIAKFFVNGAQQGSSTTLTKPLRLYTSNYHLYQASDTFSANCRLGLVRIYNKVLSESQIIKNFNAQKYLYGY